MVDKQYFPIIISSPSGGGKSTVCDAVLENHEEIVYSISYTTRPPRCNEINGVDYHFVDKEKFDEMIAEGKFLEWAKVHNYYYGTAKKTVYDALKENKFVILDLDTEGTKQFIKKIPETLSIFLFPPSMKELENRLRNRKTDDEETIQLRLQNARKEIGDAWIYDRFLINEDINEVTNKIISIIENKSKNELSY